MMSSHPKTFFLVLSTIISIGVHCKETTATVTTQSPSASGPNNWEVDSFKAIRTLHTKLDDDADGEVDDLESKRFLESAGSHSTAHKLSYLHQDGKDRSISVDELWQAWKSSQVYNWTVDETIYWLVNYVELPGYMRTFQERSINGSYLPRLATDGHFLSKLGIVDPAAKSKISIKAMDVVLFGPPKSGNASKARDIIVSIVIMIATTACYVFYSRSKASQRALQAMQDSLETLQKAEDQMQELQLELDKALKAQEAVVTEKKNLEHQLEMHRKFGSSSGANDKLKQSGSSNGDSTTIDQSSMANKQQSNLIVKLEGELKNLREELKEMTAAKQFRAPFKLRNLLQKTYNIESEFYNDKKLNLETKATEVKLRNQKLQKKKTSFLGYYKMAQENSIEEDINTIVAVKEAIMQVTREIKERTTRWREIEELCGCSLGLTHSNR